MYNPLGVDIVDYNRRLTEFGPRVSTQAIDTVRTVVGLDGKFPDDSPLKSWKWEVSFNYGHTTATQQNTGDLILSHLAENSSPAMAPVMIATASDIEKLFGSITATRRPRR